MRMMFRVIFKTVCRKKTIPDIDLSERYVRVISRCFIHNKGFHRSSNSHSTAKETEIPRTMQVWCLNQYGSNNAFEQVRLNSPVLKTPRDVIIQVHAASVNPIDLRMREGYGSRILNLQRKMEKIEEFPLILGRDFSGVVVKTGRLVKRFRPGDEVWGTPAVAKQGTHAEYVAVTQDEIALKPKSLSHVEAASIPYVACTTWVGFVSRAGITSLNAKGKRVLILGGSGGIGTFAIQLMKAWGAHVTSTCATDAIELVQSLGTDHVIDYTSTNMEKELQKLERFDVILDPFGGENERLVSSLLSRWSNAVYVSLAPPLLSRTDELGVGLGIMSSGRSLLTSSVQKALCSGSTTAWGFFAPNPGALDHVTQQVQHKKIRPVVQKVFPFSELIEAYKFLESGHARGKTVIQISNS